MRQATSVTSSTKCKRTIHDFFGVRPKHNQQLSKKRNYIKTKNQRQTNGTPLSFFSTMLDTPPSADSLSCLDYHEKNDTPPSPFSSSSSTHKKTETATTPMGCGSSSTFTPPSSQNKESDDVYRIELSVSTTPSHLKQLHAKRKMKNSCKNTDSDQFFLDFGQSDFGSRTICPICNMLYVHGVEEDEMNHAKICKDYAMGVPFQGWKNERVVHSTDKGHKIVQIRPDDPLQHRKKILQVKAIVDQELGFLSSTNSSSIDAHTNSHSPELSTSDETAISLKNKTVFLYIVQKRIVGFCSVEFISKAYKLLESCHEDYKTKDDSVSSSKNKINSTNKDPTTALQKEKQQQKQFYHSKTPTKAVMGVHQIWCHRSHRKAGIASQLVDIARSKLVFGMNIPFDEVAFSSPTIAGIAFARRYMETNTPLVYTYFNT